MLKQRYGVLAGAVVVGGACIVAPADAQDKADAQDRNVVSGTLEGFGGVASDDRALDGRKDRFSGGFLPSVAFETDGAKVQIEGLIADHFDKRVLAGGAHVGFNIDPTATVGIYGAYSNNHAYGNLNTYRIGGEALIRLGIFSISAIGGYEHTDRGTVLAGTVPGFTVYDRYGRGGQFFDMVDLVARPGANWSLTVGHRYVGGAHAAALGSEFAVPLRGAPFALFAEGRLGENGYRAIWGGIRIRFGGGGAKRDDAGFPTRLKDEMFAIGNTRRRSGVALPPPPPPPPDCAPGCGPCYPD